MGNKDDFLSLINEIIDKQSVILGPEISILKARSVAGLELDDKGKALDIKGDMEGVLQSLVDQYVELSGMIVKNALGSIFSKYPAIRGVIK